MACSLTQVNGTTISFTVSGITPRITGLSFDGISREALDDSTIETSWMEFCASNMIDPGELTLSVNADADLGVLVAGAAEPLVIQFPPKPSQTTGASFAVDGFVTGQSFGGENGEAYSGDIVVKLSGEIVVTPGS
jgi:hypothetical protein